MLEVVLSKLRRLRLDVGDCGGRHISTRKADGRKSNEDDVRKLEAG